MVNTATMVPDRGRDNDRRMTCEDTATVAAEAIRGSTAEASLAPSSPAPVRSLISILVDEDGDAMVACGRRWVSEPGRICEAKVVPDLTACLAHVGAENRRAFLASAGGDRVSLLNGLLTDLEIDETLYDDLAPTLQRIEPVVLDGSVFVDPVHISLKFAGDVDFTRCRFRRRAWFREAEFPGRTYFTSTRFDEEVSFDRARFVTDARFDMAEFSEPAMFGSFFERDVWFDRATFRSSISIVLRAGSRIRFDDANLSNVYLNVSTRDGSSRSPVRTDAAADEPPLVMFHGAAFTAEAEISARGDVDVSLARVVLRNPLSITSWEGTIRLLSLRFASLQDSVGHVMLG